MVEFFISDGCIELYSRLRKKGYSRLTSGAITILLLPIFIVALVVSDG